MGSLEQEPGSHFTGRPTVNPVASTAQDLNLTAVQNILFFLHMCFYYLHFHLYLLMHSISIS